MDQTKDLSDNCFLYYCIKASDQGRKKDLLIIKLKKELEKIQLANKNLRKKNVLKDNLLSLKEEELLMMKDQFSAEMLMMKDHFSAEIAMLKRETSERENLKDRELELLKDRIKLQEKSQDVSGKKTKPRELIESQQLAENTEKMMNVTLRKN